MVTILDGIKPANEIKTAIKRQIIENNLEPGLAVILVGDNPASEVYVKGKQKDCNECGIKSTVYRLPWDIEEANVVQLVKELNATESIHGILVQLPLPKGICENKVTQAICPSKDVDSFTYLNVGRVATGESGFEPCTPAGVIVLLDYYNINVEGKHVVVVGRSNIVGKPLALMLLRRNATVTVCHSYTEDLEYITSQADILISAVGQACLIRGIMAKDEAVVIDVAMNRNEQGKLCGDVDFDSVSKIASAISPVPGGVGPMTRAILMRNTFKAALAAKID